MSTSHDEIAALLADQDRTLVLWFETFMSTEEPELILTGGESPPPNRVGEVFDRWFRSSREQLRRLLCEQLRYGSLSKNQRSFGEVATVAAVASALASSSLHQAVDPMLTATLLVARRSLDGLCDNDGDGGSDGNGDGGAPVDPSP